MELKIGSKIAELRKAKGMTQEQLALALGISAPAVSKWETDNSYPDITLLCPLARALDTNVDTLLEYDEVMTEEKVKAYTNEIREIERNGDVLLANEKLHKLLSQLFIKVTLNAICPLRGSTFSPQEIPLVRACFCHFS